MGLNPQRKDFTRNSRGLTSPSMSQFKGVPGNEYIFSLTGENAGYPVRSLRCNEEGVLNYTDWSNVEHTLNVGERETLPIMPKIIHEDTDVNLLGYY